MALRPDGDGVTSGGRRSGRFDWKTFSSRLSPGSWVSASRSFARVGSWSSASGEEVREEILWEQGPETPKKTLERRSE